MAVELSRSARMILRLMPRGQAWKTTPGSVLSRFAQALGDEAERVTARGENLLRELDPRYSLELLPEWEELLGLPDEALGSPASLSERRGQVIYKLSARGGQSPQFYIDLARHLGFTVTITKFRPFRAGLARAGDPLTNGDWIFAWQVNANESAAMRFRAGQNTAGDPLAHSSNDQLEYAIRRAAPAHGHVLFVYA